MVAPPRPLGHGYGHWDQLGHLERGAQSGPFPGSDASITRASGRICGRRLRTALPDSVESPESHGHLSLYPDVQERLSSASASATDRLLTRGREQAGSGRRFSRCRKMASRGPGAPSMTGTYRNPGISSSPWWCTGIGLKVNRPSIASWPPVQAPDGPRRDRGRQASSQWYPSLAGPRGRPRQRQRAINDTLVSYCRQQRLEFTRSRALRKNDNAWMERKNCPAIRRFVGHDRYSGVIAGQALRPPPR